MKRGILLLSALAALAACSGPSKEELRRMQLLEAQRAEAAAIAAQQEAQARDARIQERLSAARNAWKNNTRLGKNTVDTLYAPDAAKKLDPAATYFLRSELQPARYNYADNKQSFTIVGMRNLPNSAVYGPLFPDDKAQYQPGQLAKSVLEFTLQEETEENRLGQQVLRERGQRWVAASLNFKNYETLLKKSGDWTWEPGLFDDLSWNTSPEEAYPYTSARSLTLQIGMRFCVISDRCYLESDYRKHPTHAVRADIISVLVADEKSGKILAEFVREKE
ncbi:hypothetical protein ACQUQU_04365 [Thalassolituus sp. LLYu03]|uniref:hypothetical protein n=1 Tax=Thalassolituus sp. LLYu03 TaxID=3421656 RepID=UPI003D2CB636